MVLVKKIGNYLTSKSFLINLGLIILVYVIGTFVFKSCLNSATNHGQKIEVPNLIGKNRNNLDNIMSATLLSYEVLDSIYDPTKVEGTILEQDPVATSVSSVFVKAGRSVKVRVSKRTQLVEMPSLVDRSQRFAEGILNNREFRYKIEYVPSREAHGAVLEQLYRDKPILPGTKIPIGSRILLKIGQDASGVPLTMPNLFGLTIQEAKERVGNMSNMEFFVVCPDCIVAADSSIARVTSQSPEYIDDGVVLSGTTISVFATKNFSGPIPE